MQFVKIKINIMNLTKNKINIKEQNERAKSNKTTKH